MREKAKREKYLERRRVKRLERRRDKWMMEYEEEIDLRF